MATLQCPVVFCCSLLLILGILAITSLTKDPAVSDTNDECGEPECKIMRQGERDHLPCNILDHPDSTVILVTWTKMDTFSFHDIQHVISWDPRKDRLERNDPDNYDFDKSNFSLVIRNAQKRNEGKFLCRVLYRGSKPRKFEIRLIVDDDIKGVPPTENKDSPEDNIKSVPSKESNDELLVTTKEAETTFPHADPTPGVTNTGGYTVVIICVVLVIFVSCVRLFFYVKKRRQEKKRAPTGVYFQVHSLNYITISWTTPADSTGLTGYKVEYTAGGVPFQDVINDLTRTTKTYQDNNLAGGEPSSVFVACVANDGLISSDKVQAVTPPADALPPAPIGATIKQTSYTSYTLSWTNPGNVDGYVISYTRLNDITEIIVPGERTSEVVRNLVRNAKYVFNLYSQRNGIRNLAELTTLPLSGVSDAMIFEISQKLPPIYERQYLDLVHHLGFEQWRRDMYRHTAASYTRTRESTLNMLYEWRTTKSQNLQKHELIEALERAGLQSLIKIIEDDEEF